MSPAVVQSEAGNVSGRLRALALSPFLLRKGPSRDLLVSQLHTHTSDVCECAFVLCVCLCVCVSAGVCVTVCVRMHGDLQKSGKDCTLQHLLFAAFNTD